MCVGGGGGKRYIYLLFRTAEFSFFVKTDPKNKKPTESCDTLRINQSSVSESNRAKPYALHSLTDKKQ